jgi:hypothetical protein
MTYKLRAGAPFDLDNLFNIPATDPGPIVNDYAPELLVANIDGGTFTDPTSITYDGGSIPVVGTATFNPNRVYGPNDIVTN